MDRGPEASRRHHRPVSCGSLGNQCPATSNQQLTTNDQKSCYLREIESRVADHRRHHRSPPQVDETPERASKPGAIRASAPWRRLPEPDATPVAASPKPAPPS